MPKATVDKQKVSFLKFIFKELALNGHLQSIGAGGLIYITYTLFLSTHVSWALVLIVYLIFQSIFLFDRFRDLERDKLTNEERFLHISSYVSRIPLMLFAMIGLALLLLLMRADIYSVLFGLIILVLGILYPIYFKSITKKIPLFKNVYVSAVYALLIFYPFVFDKTLDLASLGVNLFIWPVFIFFECMYAQLVLDLKDVSSDKSSGLKTAGVRFGYDRTLELIEKIAWAIPIIFIFFAFLLRISSAFIVLAVLALIINYLIYTKVKAKRISGYLISAAMFFIWFISVFIARMVLVWIY